MADKQPAPDWQRLAAAQLNAPGTEEQVAEIVAKLGKSELACFGPHLLQRLEASAYLSVGCFPLSLCQRFATCHTHLVLWVFALDAMMDTCPSMDYATDLTMLMDRRLTTPLTRPLNLAGLNLARDPYLPLPSLDYSMIDLIVTIQSLRQVLAQQMPNPAGLAIFDQCLTQVIHAMTKESAWRLNRIMPSPAQYLEVGGITTCAALCASLVNSFLPNPEASWQQIASVLAITVYASRLNNDLATAARDEDEGKPNPIPLLIPEAGSISEAEIELNSRLDTCLSELEHTCGPQLTDPTQPSYPLWFYLLYCPIVTHTWYMQETSVVAML